MSETNDEGLGPSRCYAVMTYAELARCMHNAEETDDDLTFMEVADEVFLNRKTSETLWREFYNQEWHLRMAAKAKR